MNLSRIVEHWARMRPDHCAIHFQGEDIPYAQLWGRIEQLTANLALRHRVQQGERVAWLGLNHPDFIAFLMAAARLGAIAVPLNFRLAAREIAEVLKNATAGRMFVDGPMEALGRAAAAGLNVAVEPVANLDECVSGCPELPGRDGDPLLLVYTSGTTGKPKGALHTQENLLWNTQSAIAAQDITSRDHLLSSLPMFHVGGLNIQLLPTLMAGGTVTLHSRVDPGAWLADVGARRPTLSLLVPATIRMVLEHPDWPHADLSSLRLINAGSSVVPRSMIDACHARGVPVNQVYGATETGPVSITLRSEDAVRKAGSAGKVAMHVEARLVGADGRDVADGAIGEIWVRGKNVVAGYWNDPHNSAFVDGWFKSGDLARRDEEGFFFIVGRSRDMIISGGENIYPAELENVLADCTDIVECAVLGQEDARWGEVAVAVVVRKADSRLTEAGVAALFEGRLARYKHPRRVVFAESLPKTALGKVQKAALRALMVASAG